jgi:hypothetical protein
LASFWNFPLIKNEGSTFVKNARPLTTLPNKQRHIPENFIFQEKCAFKLNKTENKSLFFPLLYILHRFAVTGVEIVAKGIMNDLTHTAWAG